MKTNSLKQIVLMGMAAIAVLMFHQVAMAIPALNFVDFDPAIVADARNIGWEFTTNSEVTITHLGFFDFQSDGLAMAHEVGIYTSLGVLVGSATVGPGTGTTLIDRFRYAEVSSPLSLAAGQTYVISAYTDPLDPSAAFASGVTTHESITYGGSHTWDAPADVGRINTFGATSSSFGPNFQVAGAVPEPSTIVLFSAGLVGLIGVRRVSRRRLDS